MTVDLLRRVRTPLIAVALLAGVPSVLALATETTPPETQVRSRTVEVSIDNGDMTVVVDGERIPDDRLRKEPHGIVVLDAHGHPMEDVTIAVPGMAAKPMHIPGLHGNGQAEDNVKVFVGPDGQVQRLDGGLKDIKWNAAPPRAMLGIRMENAEKGVRVVDVLPGTPAAKAGLRTGDIILTSEKGILTTERLAEKLQSFKPGQTVGMWILRGDEKVELKVELVAWNPDLLGSPMEIEDEDLEFEFGDDLPMEIRGLIQRLLEHGDGDMGEMEIRIEVDHDDHDDVHWDHDDHDMLGDFMHALIPHLKAMHGGFEGRWPEIEHEVNERMESFAREWERHAEDFARQVESQFRSMHENGERLGRGIEDAMRRRAEEGEQFARRIGEALRRSEEQRRMLEERVARLEAMLERLTRDAGGRPPRDAAPPPQDRPAPPDRPRRRGGRGDAPATPTSDA
jgi:hypothetical protein